MALDVESETFIVYIMALEILVYLIRKAQIAFLLIKEIKIPDKYLNYINMFLEKMFLTLLEKTELKKYTIKLEDSK